MKSYNIDEKIFTTGVASAGDRYYLFCFTMFVLEVTGNYPCARFAFIFQNRHQFFHDMRIQVHEYVCGVSDMGSENIFSLYFYISRYFSEAFLKTLASPHPSSYRTLLSPSFKVSIIFSSIPPGIGTKGASVVNIATTCAPINNNATTQTRRETDNTN